MRDCERTIPILAIENEHQNRQRHRCDVDENSDSDRIEARMTQQQLVDRTYRSINGNDAATNDRKYTAKRQRQIEEHFDRRTPLLSTKWNNSNTSTTTNKTRRRRMSILCMEQLSVLLFLLLCKSDRILVAESTASSAASIKENASQQHQFTSFETSARQSSFGVRQLQFGVSVSLGTNTPAIPPTVTPSPAPTFLPVRLPPTGNVVLPPYLLGSIPTQPAPIRLPTTQPPTRPPTQRPTAVFITQTPVEPLKVPIGWAEQSYTVHYELWTTTTITNMNVFLNTINEDLVELALPNVQIRFIYSSTSDSSASNANNDGSCERKPSNVFDIVFKDCVMITTDFTILVPSDFDASTEIDAVIRNFATTYIPADTNARIVFRETVDVSMLFEFLQTVGRQATPSVSGTGLIVNDDDDDEELPQQQLPPRGADADLFVSTLEQVLESNILKNSAFELEQVELITSSIAQQNDDRRSVDSSIAATSGVGADATKALENDNVFDKNDNRYRQLREQRMTQQHQHDDEINIEVPVNFVTTCIGDVSTSCNRKTLRNTILEVTTEGYSGSNNIDVDNMHFNELVLTQLQESNSPYWQSISGITIRDVSAETDDTGGTGDSSNTLGGFEHGDDIDDDPVMALWLIILISVIGGLFFLLICYECHRQYQISQLKDPEEMLAEHSNHSFGVQSVDMFYPGADEFGNEDVEKESPRNIYQTPVPKELAPYKSPRNRSPANSRSGGEIVVKTPPLYDGKDNYDNEEDEQTFNDKNKYGYENKSQRNIPTKTNSNRNSPNRGVVEYFDEDDDEDDDTDSQDNDINDGSDNKEGSEGSFSVRSGGAFSILDGYSVSVDGQEDEDPFEEAKRRRKQIESAKKKKHDKYKSRSGGGNNNSSDRKKKSSSSDSQYHKSKSSSRRVKR